MYYEPISLELAIGIIIIAIWTFAWKVLALWHSARHGDKAWFIIFLLVNTVGILEIIYLFGVRKLNKKKLFKK